MSVLNVYQADLLKELDEGEQFNSHDITELRRNAALALSATKETARAIGRSMAALVVAERHLWFTLSDMKKDRVFLMDAPLAPSGNFGDTINSVVDRLVSGGSISAVSPSPFYSSGGCWPGLRQPCQCSRAQWSPVSVSLSFVRPGT